MVEKTEVIGREEEKEILNGFFSSNNAEFMAVYGRRRVGKTYLIRKFFGKKSCCFFNSTGIYKESLKHQILAFTKEIGRAFLHGTELKVKSNWFDTFELLTEIIEKQVSKGKKIVLFFDEFPWMVTPRSSLLQVLDHYWNQRWSQNRNIKLIICGSAASWIIANIIHHKGGLHNRLTKTILLEPMNLKESKKLLHSMGIKLNQKQVVQIYMATGGIPYYLSQIPQGLSATQAIEKLAFSKNGLFLDEFDKLYASLFKDVAIYINIIKTIAAKRYGMSQTELFQKLKKTSKGGTIVKKLKELEEASFIISFKPYQNKRKGVYYKVIDEYTLFYFYWIEPIKTTLLKKGLRKGYWDKIRGTSGWKSWAGYAFEALCYKHLHQIAEALELNPAALPSTWQHIPQKGLEDQGAQIDLLFDRDDEAITICEIKYTSSPFAVDKECARKLEQKLSAFEKRTKTSKQLFLALISANGLKETMYSEEMVDEVVTLKDLFAF